MKSSGIGGQAVLEGVMMRNKSEYAVAVRKPDGEIAVTKGKCKSLTDRSLFFRLPIVRGVVAFFESLVIGMRTLTYSASFYEEEEEEPRSTFSFFKKKEPEVEEESSNSKISQPFDNTITASREAKKRRFTSTGSKVVSMNGRGVEVYVIKPQDFAEAQTAADLLKEGRTVVINLEGVELTVAQRSIDFVGGATYAINGSLQAVSNNIFIAAPDSIEVSGDLKSEIMNENTISPQLK
mgnify:CR=1 FL=1